MSGPLSARELARIEMVTTPVGAGQGIERAFQHALRLSSRTLRVRRLGLWFGEDDFARIRARCVYDAAADSFDRDEVIDLTPCPTYAASLRSRKVVVAADARTDPRTSELGPYLARHGIASMLDSPVFRSGQLVGVVCHEHVGEPRPWDRGEVDFASSVSDMLGLYLEQEAMQRTYEQLLAARAELEQARIMDSLGRMAASVAHDLNNILAAVGLSAELLARRSAEPGVRASANDILAVVDQGRRMNQHLLTFAQGEDVPTARVDALEAARSMRPALAALAGPDVELRLEVAGDAARVGLTREEFERVVGNLVVNAREAMFGGGRLGVRVAVQDDEVVLRVTDTGVGMDEDTRRRMFEPYFSTKAMRGGHGLGLATVYGLVARAGGRITVTSALGEGTTIELCVPRLAA